MKCNSELVQASNLDINTPSGTPLIRNVNFQLFKGEKMIVTGGSGCGKSALIKAICGANDHCKGSVLLPHGTNIHYEPQKTVFPLLPLKGILAYPNPDKTYMRTEMENGALKTCAAESDQLPGTTMISICNQSKLIAKYEKHAQIKDNRLMLTHNAQRFNPAFARTFV